LFTSSSLDLSTPTGTGGPTKNPLAFRAQEVASERDVAFAVRSAAGRT
jgi:hypothetical protein